MANYLKKGAFAAKVLGGCSAVLFGYQIGYPYTRDVYLSNWKIDETDGYEVYKIDKAFEKLQRNTECNSLLKKHLTKDVKEKIKYKKTKLGGTLLHVINSGVENPDSCVGIYAPDAESYRVFSLLFQPLIEEYHGFKKGQKQPHEEFGEDQISELQDLDPEGKYILSTRIRCGRTLAGYPFNPLLTQDDYLIIEEKVKRAFNQIRKDPELKGTYYSLKGMTKEVQKQLVADHFLFKEGDRFLQAAGACRYWPSGRGIYHNDSKTFLVWVNEEDHLRIISMQKGGNVGQVLERLIKGVKAIENKVSFYRDPQLGWLTFCPTNLGTTLRASVHIKLPKISSKPNFKKICDELGLQIRGIHGEHSESTDNIYDISNKERLGLSEIEIIKKMYYGIKKLIQLEKDA